MNSAILTVFYFRVHIVFAMALYRQLMSAKCTEPSISVGHITFHTSNEDCYNVLVSVIGHEQALVNAPGMPTRSPLASTAIHGYGRVLPQLSARDYIQKPNVPIGVESVYFKQSVVNFGCVAIGTISRSKVDLCNSSDHDVSVTAVLNIARLAPYLFTTTHRV